MSGLESRPLAGIAAWLRQRDLRGWVLPLALLAVWWLVTQLHWVNTRLIVPPSGVFKVGAETLASGAFYTGVFASLARDLAGLILGAVSGIALGTLIGASKQADRFIGPSFHTLRQISLFAWLPLLSSWLGTGDLPKVLFIALSALYPITLGTIEGVRSVSLAHAEVARVYGFDRKQRLLRLILPAAAPQILTGLHLGVVYAWLATIGAEYLLASSADGLGNIVFRGRAAFNVELILVGLFAIGVIGAVFNRLAGRLEAQALQWRASGTLR